MPDITMCQDAACERSKECYRFMAVPGWLQSYAATFRQDGQCDRFIGIMDGLHKWAQRQGQLKHPKVHTDKFGRR